MIFINLFRTLILGVALSIASVSVASQLPGNSGTVLVPIPSYGFDPTEASVPWKYIKDAGFKVVFATPNGKQGRADARMVTGQDLGVFKSVLMNDENGTKTYSELQQSYEFQHPISYQDIRSQDYDVLFLPGGHDKGMKEYLGSSIIQKTISEFFDANKPVGAICHGTLVTARSISKKTGHSVLWGRKTTGLTRLQELIPYNMTRNYLGAYYRTYPELDTKNKMVTMEDELKSYLKDPDDFNSGPGFPIPIKRDSPENLAPGFTILDGNYLSARWPGDAHKFGNDFVKLLKSFTKQGNSRRIYYIPAKVGLSGINLRVGEYIPAGDILGDVLYLTGFADRLDNHDPLFKEFNDAGFRVISFDYPSHGETYGSENSLDNFSFSDLAQLAKLVESKTQVDAQRPLVIAGWSTGGLLATRMLQTKVFERSSRQPKGLILYAPGVVVRPLVGRNGFVTQDTLTHNPNPPHAGPIMPTTPLKYPLFAAKLLTNAALANIESLPQEIPVLTFIGSPREDKYVYENAVGDWVRAQRQKGVQMYGVSCPNADHELDNEPDELGGREVRLSSAHFLRNVIAHQLSSMEIVAKQACHDF